MVKKIRRKVKKIAMKATLTSMELEDLTEENEEQKRILSEDFKKEFEFIEWKRKQAELKEQENSSPEEQGSQDDDKEPPEDCDDILENSKPSNTPVEIKKLYRSIAQLTHPDKVQDERMNEIFRLTAEAMSEENWMLLVEFAAELHIDIEFLSDETCEIIEESIKRNQGKIAGIKNSFSYMWSSQKDDKSRSIFKAMFYQKFKINKEEFQNWLESSPP